LIHIKRLQVELSGHISVTPKKSKHRPVVVLNGLARELRRAHSKDIASFPDRSLTPSQKTFG
jgi:hypothetical protein